MSDDGRDRFVPSRALAHWTNVRRAALDEIAAAHVAVGGGRRGRRHATLQINYAYAMLLSSQFQGFCRDLHSKAVEHLVAPAPADLHRALGAAMVHGRKLDRGNPNPSNLGEDFGRIGLAFWPAVNGYDARNPGRRASLEELNTWRNAIAHQDWAHVGPNLRPQDVRAWRAACRTLAVYFDRAVGAYVAGLVGVAPW